MTAPVKTKTFKSGNSVALRLPKGLAIAPGETMIVERKGDVVTARRIPTAAEEAERLERWREAVRTLIEMGPIGEIQEREPIEFPDRPGLY